MGVAMSAVTSTELTLATLGEHVGSTLGVTDWVSCDQTRIQSFADCTQDQQWIHVDVERAKAESPFGGPVAHGMLTLSMLPYWIFELPAVPADAGVVINYGFDKVRFIAPVPSGRRVRSHIKLSRVDDKGKGRLLASMEHTVEIEGQDKPALIAEFLVMFAP